MPHACGATVEKRWVIETPESAAILFKYPRNTVMISQIKYG